MGLFQAKLTVFGLIPHPYDVGSASSMRSLGDKNQVDPRLGIYLNNLRKCLEIFDLFGPQLSLKLGELSKFNSSF